MGQFRDAVATGREAAKKEQEQQKAAADARAAATQADIEAGKKWLAEDVRPVVDAANDDLSEEKLGIVWEPNPGENPSVKLDFRIMNTLGGHPAGRSIGLTVFPGGKVKACQDGGQETDLGTITTVGSDKIQNLLMKILQEIGAQRG